MTKYNTYKTQLENNITKIWGGGGEKWQWLLMQYATINVKIPEHLKESQTCNSIPPENKMLKPMTQINVKPDSHMNDPCNSNTF